MRWSLLALFLLLACGGESRDVVKRTIDETRTKPRVDVQIRLEKPGFPSQQDVDLQRKLEADVEQQHIGSVVKSESGEGYLQFTVEVDDTTVSIPQIRKLLANAGVLQRTTIKIAA